MEKTKHQEQKVECHFCNGKIRTYASVVCSCCMGKHVDVLLTQEEIEEYKKLKDIS